MEYSDLIRLYNDCTDFREYVDRYVTNYQEGNSISVEDALKHATVRWYAMWLLGRR